uniref:Uncharacterized protein n=1 Tax=Macrostomum lignano TaxID=282301 RepID=A0A1I8FLC2_9PLAT
MLLWGDKRHASDKHPQRPRAALLFSASSSARVGHSCSLLQLAEALADSSPTQQLDGYAQLHEQREQLEALPLRIPIALAKKVAADFGSSDGKLPTRQFGLKSLSPEELVSLHSLKRLERGLRDGAAPCNANAELRLAAWPAGKPGRNHGDCVAPSSDRSRRRRHPASRSTSRTGTSVGVSASSPALAVGHRDSSLGLPGQPARLRSCSLQQQPSSGANSGGVGLLKTVRRLAADALSASRTTAELFY